MRFSYRICALAGAALLVLPYGLGSAQTQRSGANANAQVMQQLQQLASERTTLQTENARLKADLDKLRKEHDALKSGQAAVEQRARAAASAAATSTAARSTADVQRLESELARDRERTQELVTRFRETANTLREVETDRTGVRQQLAQKEQDLGACVKDNVALGALNGEILARMEDADFWSVLGRKEPFTRIKRNQLENLVDGYRNKAADLKATPVPARPAPP